jgi:hypothetical protein
VGSRTEDVLRLARRGVRHLKDRHLLSATGETIADPFLRDWILMDAAPDGVSRIEAYG